MAADDPSAGVCHVHRQGLTRLATAKDQQLIFFDVGHVTLLDLTSVMTGLSPSVIVSASR
jgi:hypothetical protein